MTAKSSKKKKGGQTRRYYGNNINPRLLETPIMQKYNSPKKLYSLKKKNGFFNRIKKSVKKRLFSKKRDNRIKREYKKKSNLYLRRKDLDLRRKQRNNLKKLKSANIRANRLGHIYEGSRYSYKHLKPPPLYYPTLKNQRKPNPYNY